MTREKCWIVNMLRNQNQPLNLTQSINLHKPVELSEILDQDPVADGRRDREEGVREDGEDPRGDDEPEGRVTNVLEVLLFHATTSGHVQGHVSVAAPDGGRVSVHRVVVISDKQKHYFYC